VNLDAQVLELVEQAGYLQGAIMSVQSQINAIVAVLDPFVANVSDVAARLAAGEGSAVDLSQLQAIADQVPSVQAALDAAVPATTGTTSSTSSTSSGASTHTTATTSS
jgi:hypothetical protein